MFTMPGRKEHIVISAFTAVAANIVMQLFESEEQKVDIIELIQAAFLGAIGGVLPVLIEPAVNPNHRKFFHSYSTMLGVGYSVAGKHTKKCSRFRKRMMVSAVIGYISHLIADSTTSKGLPFV